MLAEWPTPRCPHGPAIALRGGAGPHQEPNRQLVDGLGPILALPPIHGPTPRRLPSPVDVLGLGRDVHSLVIRLVLAPERRRIHLAPCSTKSLYKASTNASPSLFREPGGRPFGLPDWPGFPGSPLMRPGSSMMGV